MKKTLVQQRQRWQVAFLAACLVLAQALWLLHGVAHFEVSRRAVMTDVSTEVRTHAKVPACDHAVSHWAQALLPDHQNERSCADYDQHSHADAAPGGDWGVVSQAPGDLAQATHVASGMAAQAAGFLARGPPANA